MIYDITPSLSDRLAVWPGDFALQRVVLSRMEDGAATTGSAIHATVHLGAHADAPSHYDLMGDTIDNRSLDHYLGRCQVIEVNVAKAQAILPGHISVEIDAPRVLFATQTYDDRDVFTDDFAALSIELVHWLAKRGVRTVGIDTPSVDLYADETLPVHRACFEHNFAILEGLLLDDVPSGCYELIALPLKLVDFDASPVRAILRTLPE